MNATIINNINAVVGPEDKIINLGDIKFGKKETLPMLLSRIACQTIVLLPGNHDEWLFDAGRRDWVAKECPSLFLAKEAYYETRVGKTLVTMMHYPLSSWNEIGRGSVNLYGHCHGTHINRGRQIDVGVDAQDFKPLLLEDAVKLASKQEVVVVDHHTSKTNYY